MPPDNGNGLRSHVREEQTLSVSPFDELDVEVPEDKIEVLGAETPQVRMKRARRSAGKHNGKVWLQGAHCRPTHTGIVRIQPIRCQ